MTSEEFYNWGYPISNKAKSMTENEFRTGKFDASKETAAAIMADDAKPFDYIAEALVTLSPEFHGEMVARRVWVKAINDFIAAANALDKVKKSLFYGRDNNIGPNEGQQDAGAIVAYVSVNTIHAIIGIATEAGELCEALRDTINGVDPIDAINLREEAGDSFWYHAILANECGYTFEDAQRINIDKLRARFPNKFVEYDANNRDLSKERIILEDKG